MTNIATSPLDVAQAWVSQSLDYERILSCCAFSPCGRYLAAGGQHELVQRWNLDNGQRTSLAAHRSWVDALAFLPGGKRLFTADHQGTIHAWDYEAASDKPVWSKPSAHHGCIRALAATAEGRLLSAGRDHTIRMWSSDDGAAQREFPGHECDVFSLAVHPDGEQFASGDLFGNVHVWDGGTGALLRTLDAGVLHTRGEDFIADVGGVRSLAFDPRGERLACGGMTDIKSNTFCPGKPAILVFDWASGQLLETLRPQHTSDGPIKGLQFLPDGTLAAHAEHLNGQSSLEFWRLGEPKSIHMIKRQSGYCLDLHPDGRRLAAATFKPNGRGGNGRHADRADYVSHDGQIDIFSLFEKPAAT